MDIKRAELKNRAKSIFAIKCWPLFVMALVPHLGYVAATVFGVGIFFEILFVAPFKAAYSKLLIDNSKNEEIVGYRELITFFRGNYSDLLKNTFIRDIFLILWKIPLMIGIIVIFIGIYSIFGVELIRGGGLVFGELTGIDFSEFMEMLTQVGVNVEELKIALADDSIYSYILLQSVQSLFHKSYHS